MSTVVYEKADTHAPSFARGHLLHRLLISSPENTPISLSFVIRSISSFLLHDLRCNILAYLRAILVIASDIHAYKRH